MGTDPVTNKKRYASRTVRAGKREAQRVLNEIVTEAEQGLSVRTSATVGELLERWFEFAARDFSPKTVKETRGFIDRNLLPTLGPVPLSKLRASDLDRFYRKLQTSGGVGGRPLAPGTVRRIHGILRRALGQGLTWGWIGINPAVATTPPRVPKFDIKPPSGAEVAQVLRRAAETSPELECFLVLSAATGARRSEIVALRWNDVDLVGQTVATVGGSSPGLMAWLRRTPRVMQLAGLHSTSVLWFCSLTTPSTCTPTPRHAESRSTTTRSCSATRSTAPSRGTRTRSLAASRACASSKVCMVCAYTTCAISSPHNCSVPASTFAPSPAGSVIATRRPRSMSTPTSLRSPTGRQPM